MRKNLCSVRPAGAAIAAVLAIGATPSFAQEVNAQAAPVVQAPAPEVTAPASTPTADASPTFTPSQPVVQPTPSVEERLNASIAAANADRAPTPVAREAVTSATRTEKAPAKAVATRTSTTRSVDAQQPMRSQAKAEPAIAAAPPVAPKAAPAAPETVAATPNPSVATPDPALLAAIGGGALLIAGLAGVAVARRRRRMGDDPALDTVVYAEPVTDRPVDRVAEPVIVPELAHAPVLSANRQTASMTHLPADERLHAMVAAPPSPENPFRTHKKRMTRAKFLLAQEERAGRPAVAAQIPASTWVQPQQVQTVYRFGSDRGKSPSFRPRTN